MAKTIKRNPALLSNMATKLKRQAYNNGINFDLVKSWVAGNTFVIQKKVDWDTPIELIITNIVQEVEKDSVFPEQYYLIYGQNDIVVKIYHGTLLSPRCEEYEIFKNWKYYFQLKDKIAEKRKKEMQGLKEYLDSYIAFRQNFENTNPEKLI